jgi:hypothetical protein
MLLPFHQHDLQLDRPRFWLAACSDAARGLEHFVEDEFDR